MGELPGEVNFAAFRIAQAAVANVVRHARARRAVIRIARGGTRLALEIEDDGVGFDARLDGNAEGMGIAGMRARAASAGGALQIDAAPGRGTRVRAELALEEPRP